MTSPDPDQSNRGVIDVEALYSADTATEHLPQDCRVVEEDALLLDIDGVGHYTLMWTPTGVADVAHGYSFEDGVLGEVEQPEGLALALGFALSEGLIEDLSDLKSIAVCPDRSGVVRVQLHRPEAVTAHRRNVIINSSCGICGPQEILEDNALGLEDVPDTLRLRRGQFPLLMEQMRAQQRIFHETGGSHAAAIIDPGGEIVALAEDLGRHNALDKAIGLALLERGSVRGCGAVLSSRLSLELVLKAVRTDLEIMLAVSAPTSLAIDVAERFGVTLCGFVRDSRATIYSHPHRILP